ncbi:TPA: hypothetical protein GHF72_20555 [Providencia stuartii]|uniref:Uncharacterized protein n=2 Tax=Providencia stuartii TaxID=588 RepID=A0AA86YRB0_PROST|nr:hypothetical protein S70_18100 [Providencia stuartii MRSN 2154]APG49488.1 hypothetical protein BGK56_00350 [Providencia stuartii]EDU58811.1 hypothetical protein PROSTU_01992 [Providencia stuartii ATCC 25827]GHB90919.1 hypothetical protein GCM10007290_16650 [Providencia thailandensis]KNZ83676.1 hypothetical protein AFL46_15535 [Providencia stuartii]
MLLIELVTEDKVPVPSSVPLFSAEGDNPMLKGMFFEQVTLNVVFDDGLLVFKLTEPKLISELTLTWQELVTVIKT